MVSLIFHGLHTVENIKGLPTKLVLIIIKLLVKGKLF